MTKKNRFLWILIFIIITRNVVKAQEQQADSSYVKKYNYNSTKNQVIGGDISIGHGIWNDNVARYFTNQVFLSVNPGFCLNRFVFQMNDWIGFGKAKQTVVFTDEYEWEKDNGYLSFILGFNAGYAIVDSRTFKLVPIGGIGVNMLIPFFSSSNDEEETELAPRSFLPFYKLGAFIDFKSVSLFNSFFNPGGGGYTSLRLSFGITHPIGKTTYSEYYHGRMIYVAVGIGIYE